MKTYDVILTLGNGLTFDWKLPSIVSTQLEYVAELYKKQIAPYIIVSGKYSINFTIEGATPPVTESALMKDTLLTVGVPEEHILVEDESQDTIGNFYFSKTKFLIPMNMRSLLVVCTDFHLKRVMFLAEKIVGSSFHIDYQTTPSVSVQDKSFMQVQEETYKRQEQFLATINNGDDSFLKKTII